MSFSVVGRAAIVLATALVVALPVEVGAVGNGNSGIAPDYTPAAPPSDAVKLRYRFRVDRNEGPAGKIVFAGSTVEGLPYLGPYHLEYNVYTHGLAHADGICATYPPQGIPVPEEARLTLAVVDYPVGGRFGLKTSDARMFPRQSMVVDNIPGLQSVTANSQVSMNGKDVLMEVSRGGWVDDASGWKTCSADPLDGEDPYRAWEVKASFDGGEYTATVALPEGDSSYFKDVFAIWTEFLATPGPIRIYYWDIAYQREGDPTWVPIPNWKVAYRDGTAANPGGFGFRIGAYQGHRVIEVSNDPALHYADAGTTLSLDGPAYEPTAPITWRVLSDGDSGRVYELSNQRRPLPPVK